MKSDIKIGTTVWCLPNKDIEMCKSAHELGLEAIELDVGKDYMNHPLLDEKNCYNLKNDAEKYGIIFPSVGLNGIGQFPHCKKENLENALIFCDYVIKVANNMGIKLLQVPNFGPNLIRNEEEFVDNANFFTALCDKASEYGILVGTENAMSLEQNIRLINDVKRDNLKIYFDTQNHYVVNGYDQAEIADGLFEHIAEVHVKDGIGQMSNRLLGQGDSSFMQTATVLKNRGYKGAMLLENDYPKIAKNKSEDVIKELFFQDVKFVKSIFEI